MEMEGESMLSNRSKWAVLAAALVLLDTSCLRAERARHEHALAVKAEADADLAHAQADSLRQAQQEPEFFEGDVAPEVPAAQQESRPSAPSPAHVWIAGYYTRRAGQWVWVSGRYSVPPRSDVVWVPGHWVSHLDGYVWIDGAWR